MDDATYCKYMRTFKDTWKVRKHEDGVYKIFGKYGVVAPYSMDCTKLGVWVDYDGVSNEGRFKRKVKFINSKLDDVVEWDSCNTSLIGIFNQKDPDTVCKTIAARKVRQYSSETLEKLRATAKANFN